VDPLLQRTAVDTVAALARREVSPLELVEAAATRIAEVEPAVNALPITTLDRARRQARALQERPLADPPPWYLHGLPMAVKDLADVAGVRTTRGSKVFADEVATRSDFVVEHLEERGAVTVAKSNVPEFGAGSHTFNDVFGVTRNPWNLSRSAGGSSGGSAAALATGEVWLATGSDLGGSCRNPASFCGVVGVRPGPGVVPSGPRTDPWDTLAVKGPLARTVADAALMLDAMAGRHPGDPLSRPRPERSYLAAAREPHAPRRVAFSPDLGGITPVHPEVARICRDAAESMAAAGVDVRDDCIDLGDAAATFHVLRAVGYVRDHAAMLAHRDVVKPEVIWNVEAGLRVTPDEYAAALAARGALFHRTVAFFDHYDVLACPAAIVSPFPVEQRWPDAVAGTRLEHYTDWLLVCSAITLTSAPALSVPCGFTTDGLPVGLQLVAAPGAEHHLLSVAAWWEQLADLVAQVPRDPA
jgi:amidase